MNAEDQCGWPITIEGFGGHIEGFGGGDISAEDEFGITS